MEAWLGYGRDTRARAPRPSPLAFPQLRESEITKTESSSRPDPIQFHLSLYSACIKQEHPSLFPISIPPYLQCSLPAKFSALSSAGLSLPLPARYVMAIPSYSRALHH